MTWRSTTTESRISHAIIRATVDGLTVEDLGSLNGTWVDGTRIEAPTPLGSGDIVEVGRILIEVRSGRSFFVVRNGALAGARFEVDGKLSVGRQDADLIIDDEQVSRRHAIVHQTAIGLTIEDIGSVNGTMVNRRRIAHSTPLSMHDTIEIGSVKLEVEATARDELPGRHGNERRPGHRRSGGR